MLLVNWKQLKNKKMAKLLSEIRKEKTIESIENVVGTGKEAAAKLSAEFYNYNQTTNEQQEKPTNNSKRN